MKKNIHLSIKHQPDELTCGPTCLQSIYGFYNDNVPLSDVVSEVRMLREGGTFASHLANHALKRGYKAIIYSFNLQIFDPTWRELPPSEMIQKLELQAQHKSKGWQKLNVATSGYREFCQLGGELRFEDLTSRLLSSFLSNHQPIIVGLSATYLYRSKREALLKNGLYDYDDITGDPSGHFVVLTGLDQVHNEVIINDPYAPNLLSNSPIYKVPIEHLICSVLLGVVTYDANLLIISPKNQNGG
ncbi:MAG: hypothetical protein KA436_07145 [Oligoflexales bacterium]|nr:hypothetical protein [Oligoflexales bacterium]